MGGKPATATCPILLEYYLGDIFVGVGIICIDINK